MAKIRIYADENVHYAVVRGLQQRGVDAEAAQEIGNAGFTDETHFEYAARNRMVLFTHDPDLIDIARRWQQEDKEHWGLLYVHQGSLTIGETIRRLRDYVTILDADAMKNSVEYL